MVSEQAFGSKVSGELQRLGEVGAQVASRRLLRSDERSADVSGEHGGHGTEAASGDDGSSSASTGREESERDEQGESADEGRLSCEEALPSLVHGDLVVKVESAMRDLPQCRQFQRFLARWADRGSSGASRHTSTSGVSHS